MSNQHAHPHRIFVPEQVQAVKPPPAIAQRLAQLRAEALERAQALAKKDRAVWPFAFKH